MFRPTCAENVDSFTVATCHGLNSIAPQIHMAKPEPPRALCLETGPQEVTLWMVEDKRDSPTGQDLSTRRRGPACEEDLTSDRRGVR